MAHDFKKFPELTNNQIQFYYWDSPHKQLFEGFLAKVVKVSDGDTIRATMQERDFDFPIRLRGIDAPEIEEGGLASAKWLRDKILGEEVYVQIDPKNRVGKFGRLIGDVIYGGDSMSDAALREGRAVVFGEVAIWV